MAADGRLIIAAVLFTFGLIQVDIILVHLIALTVHVQQNIREQEATPTVITNSKPEASKSPTVSPGSAMWTDWLKSKRIL